jgi:hypothetical protein
LSRIIRQDQEFLGRLDWAWAASFAIAALFLGPAVQDAFFTSRSLASLIIFVILSVTIILPFVVEIWAYVSQSAGRRFLSWVMLVSAVIVMLVDYIFDALVLGKVGAMISGTISGLMIFFSVMYCGSHLSRYFQGKLKSNVYRAQIPTVSPASGFGWGVRSILYFYILAGLLVAILFGL